MKKALLFAALMVVTTGLFAQEEKEVTTGAGYANDVYYSLENGNVDTVARNNWDLGFTTSNFSVSILANTTSGVEVYTWPAGDTANWETLALDVGFETPSSFIAMFRRAMGTTPARYFRGE